MLYLRGTVISAILNVNTKTCKGGDFNFVFFYGDVHRFSSYGVIILQHIRFAIVFS